jgi:hypothetical protein
MSRLVAPQRIYRLIVNGKFNAYLLWPFGKKKILVVTVAQSTASNSTVFIFILSLLGKVKEIGHQSLRSVHI